MMKARVLPPVGFLCLGLLLGQGCAPKNSGVLQKPPVASSSGPVSEADLGVPLYPNAKADNNQSFTFRGNSKSNSAKTVSTSLVTPDSVGRVRDFYREKLGRGLHVEEYQSGSGPLIDMLLRKSKKRIRIQAAPQAGGRGAVIVILTQGE